MRTIALLPEHATADLGRRLEINSNAADYIRFALAKAARNGNPVDALALFSTWLHEPERAATASSRPPRHDDRLT